MTKRNFRKTVLTGVAFVALIASQGADAAEKLRISLDTNPSHVRNKGVELFVEVLKKKVGDKLDVEVYPSAQLYRDRDVGRALRQGSVEMAIPGTWVLDGMVPSFAITSLPIFYGLDEDVTVSLMDGALGEAINERAEERMRVKVLGPWMNLGFSHFYSASHPLKSYDDLKGLKIRISGGTANAERVKALGGIPNVIPWPDVPLALSSSTVDAVSSTHESIASAKLWDSGLSYAFEDQQWFGQYVPMVSGRFWDGLSDELKSAMTDAWAETVGEERRLAAKAQSDARKALENHGISIVTARREALAKKRAEIMRVQDEVVAEMDIDPDLVEMAVKEVRGHAGTE